MRHGLLIPALATLCGLAVLLALGTWQVERKAWKETLIATLNERAAAAPVALPAPEQWGALTAENSRPPPVAPAKSPVPPVTSKVVSMRRPCSSQSSWCEWMRIVPLPKVTSGTAEPLVDEAITTNPSSAQGLRCFLPCRFAVVAPGADLPVRCGPPSPQEDRLVLAQAEPGPALRRFSQRPRPPDCRRLQPVRRAAETMALNRPPHLDEVVHAAQAHAR